MKKLLLKVKNKTLTLFLKETKTASIIYESTPIHSIVNTWGEEIYFNTNLLIQKEKDAKSVMNLGEIAFWTEGSSIAIGYGKTPISSGDEIRLAAPCNVWATASFEKSFFDKVNDGDKISIEKN